MGHSPPPSFEPNIDMLQGATAPCHTPGFGPELVALIRENMDKWPVGSPAQPNACDGFVVF